MRNIDLARKRRNVENPFEILSNGITVRLKAGYTAGVVGQADGDSSGKIYTAVDNLMLYSLDPATDDYTGVCTTLVTNIVGLFANTSFNQNISHFDTFNVTDMASMFQANTTFNQNINSWDTSNVTRMKEMFFRASSFNKPLNDWDVSSVTDMSELFEEASAFNQPLDNWDVSNVTKMPFMFSRAYNFNQNINNWNVSSVTNMRYMFRNASVFNQLLNSWDVSSVTNMSNMFRLANSFNQPLNNWDVLSVTNMNRMFSLAGAFNQNINNWDVSSVTDMTAMFTRANAFNQPLDNWDVSSVTNMSSMFFSINIFNQPLNNWDVSNVIYMSNMFFGADAFNQPLNNWDVSSVTDMEAMFGNAYLFNQDLSSWCVEQIATEPTDFDAGATSWTLPKPDWGATCGVTAFTDAKLAIHLADLGLGATHVVRVRRDFDDTQQDFTATEIIDGTLISFCGAGSGFVAKGYDQQSGLYNAIQTNPNFQPKIVDSGSLIIEDGYPVIKFDGVDDYMEIAYGSNSDNTYAMKVVNNSGGSYKYIFGADAGLAHSPFGIQGRQFADEWQIKDSGTKNDITTTYPVGSGMNIFIIRNTTTELYINNNLEVSQAITPTNFSGIHLGAYKNSLWCGVSFRGFAVWDSDKTTDRVEIQNTMNT